MALGDLMVSRFQQSQLVGSHYLEECFGEGGAEFNARLRDSEVGSSNYGDSAAMPSMSMCYFPPGVFLCGPESDDFEAYAGKGSQEKGLVSKWRPKDRMKTSCVALVLCLNINVDPPDVIKISPCARMECWIDPFSMVAPKALEAIGKTLSSQYERWQPRARYKIQLDPTVEEVKKLCISCRKFAKSERVLFHYNGHGVPKPTANGEIWLFNKSYTQYIPLPISDLDSWMQTPSIYVFDCSSAGMIVNAFIELHDLNASGSFGAPRDCILLAACEAHETLPQSDEFPADVFTSCLTTPIKMALKWFRRRSLLRDFLDDDDIDSIPGLQNDRKTLLGELNWIFTAVTDTIAWNVLPRDLFQRLFRQDLLVASLFRNFLLADRIMRSANCSPISHPILPPTHQHHMWDAWDMAAEICLSRLPSLRNDPDAEFQASPFFTEQLVAFEVWLNHGSEHKKPPEQLPIVLQVLLSQCHRYRALMLLGQFLDMGAWAVDLALSVGIFPYVLKLLQTTTPELRQLLVFIWTKILAHDKSCQVDLVKDGGHKYFIRFLDSAEAFTEQRTMAAFVLAVIVDGHKRGQEACIESGLIQVCLRHIGNSSPDDIPAESLFVQWACLCLGKIWENFTEAQITGLQTSSHSMIAGLLVYPQPEVRASAVFSLGTLLDVGLVSSRDNVGDDDECVDDSIEVEVTIVKSILSVISDGSPLVRAEIAVALSRFTLVHNKHLKMIAAAYLKPQSNSLVNPLSSSVYSEGLSGGADRTMYRSPIGTDIIAGSNSKAMMSVDRITTKSSPGAASKILHGSPLSDDSSQNSDSGVMNERVIAGDSNAKPRALDNATYSQVVSALRSLAKDPSPYVAKLGKQVLSIIGIEQVVTKPLRTISSSRPGESAKASANLSLAGLVRSSSWFDMNGGHSSLTFRTPPVSPPRPTYLTRIRRVSSLEFRPHLMGSPDSGLADPLLSGRSTGTPEHFLPQSTIYNWSCGHFSKPLLVATDDIEELSAKRREREKLAMDHIVKCQHSGVRKFNESISRWDTKFEMGTKASLMHPFSPIVVVADESEYIRVWNYEEASISNGFDNHHFANKGVTKLCLVNELDDSLLLVASSDGNIRLWKDYSIKGQQKLVTAFSSIQGHKPGVRSLNPVVDWQQQSGFLYASGEISSIMTWSLERGQLVNALPSPTDCSISALSASPVHSGQLATGYVDGTVRLFDVRAPDSLVYTASPHTKESEKVMGLGFHPGLDPVKLVSASQAGDVQVIDMRYSKGSYASFEAHKGSLTAFAIHRHAPIIASGSARQLIKVYSLEGDLLGSMQNSPIFMPQKTGPISCLAFHPYRMLLAAGTTDPFVSIFADDKYQSR
uniref:Raptor N-terminal CASPase-like domain-containing protein n=1 Tax=Kalanchoe fedtschenkoi TaxID=63787 RepID=A0A7N0VD95_KALFE